jgi:transcription elongation factor GreA
LSASQIIDIKKIECTGRVIFGSTVSLLDMQNDEKISYQIVGEDEANVKNGKISYSSPLARSLIGKEEGEATKFESPSGIKEYEILEVSHI